jgi:WD40 repeat protein
MKSIIRSILGLILSINILYSNEIKIPHESFQAHEFDIFSLDITDDGKYGVSGSYDQTLKLWDLTSQKLLLEFSGHEDSVVKVVFSNDNKKIYSASRDKKVILWDLKTASQETAIGFETEITDMIINKANDMIVVGDNFGKVTISATDGTILYELDQNIDEITSLTFSEDERYLIAGSKNGNISIWDATSDYELVDLFIAHGSSVNAIATTKDSSYFVTAGTDKLIKIWNFADLKLIKTLQGHKSSVDALVVSSDSKTIISSGNDDSIKIWEYDSQAEPITLKAHKSAVNTLALSEDNSKLISAGLDQNIIAWNIYLFSYATDINTVDSYDKFMNIYPKSVYNKIAMKRIFEFYKQKKSISSYQKFLKKYKGSPFIKESQKTIYEMAFKDAKTKGTIESYNKFIFQYPKAPQVSDANSAVKKYEIEKYIETVYGENAETVGANITEWTNKFVLFFTESSRVELILHDAEEILSKASGAKNKLGYYIVANRLYEILKKSEFNENGIASKFFASSEYSSFESRLKKLQDKKYTIQDFI